MVLSFGTKAETLERLAPVLTTARILPQSRFSVGEWRDERATVLQQLQQGGWFDRPVIVRSSALREDSATESLAGQFASVPTVQGLTAVELGIEQVIRSYQVPQEGDQVFLQPQLQEATLSGVAFNIDPATGGPYLVVNEHASSETGQVTSGNTADDQLFYWLYGTALPAEPHLLALIRLMAELEQCLGCHALDVEFAWANGTLYLLQVRPLVRVPAFERSAEECVRSVACLADKLMRRATEFPQVLGTGIAWGAMPDWNPAEMIGLRPRPLAAGLYRECLTDRIWAEQRRNYGYRDVTGVPLMECYGGQALINIRASITSFVPADLPNDLAQRLANDALAGLCARPELHDKVETELLFHCWTFDLPERLSHRQAQGVITTEEAALCTQALKSLTWRILDDHTGPWREDRNRLLAFEEWIETVVANRPTETPATLRTLLRRCRDEAALAFAGLARAGFVAVCLINSLVDIGLWTADDRERFFRSQRTILSQLHTDRSQLSTDAFLQRYGHLRPGTYDLLVPRYDEAPTAYGLTTSAVTSVATEPFELTPMQACLLSALLDQHALPFTPQSFLQLMSDAIVWRERGKFVYSHGISELLRGLGQYARTQGVSLEECVYADQSLWDPEVADADFPARLRSAIAAGQAAAQEAQGITLPPLILAIEELTAFRFPPCQPNFITRSEAVGPVLEMSPAASCGPSHKLHGAILLLPSADPGYDWIFSTGIVGFVTKFGGANSHMAIRAREWNLPAAIGVGEVRYRRLVQARALRIDALHQLLVTLP